MLYRPPCAARRRRGAAVVELAFLLPILCTLAVIATDFAQVFYYDLTIYNCARNGAVWMSDPVAQKQSPYLTLQDAALADATNISPAPTVTSTGPSAPDANGNQEVSVTVSYTFQTITNYPGVPSTWNLSRTVTMRVAPRLPNF